MSQTNQSVWTSLVRSMELKTIGFRGTLKEEELQALQSKFNTTFETLVEQSPKLDAKELQVLEMYASLNFGQDDDLGLPEDMVSSLQAIFRAKKLTLKAPIVLYRGEIRNDTDLEYSCDLGDCISSWSTSPYYALHYAIVHSVNPQEVHATVNKRQDPSGKATLFCAILEAGMDILPLATRIRGECEVLLFHQGRIEPSEVPDISMLHRGFPPASPPHNLLVVQNALQAIRDGGRIVAGRLRFA